MGTCSYHSSCCQSIEIKGSPSCKDSANNDLRVDGKYSKIYTDKTPYVVYKLQDKQLYIHFRLGSNPSIFIKKISKICKKFESLKHAKKLKGVPGLKHSNFHLSFRLRRQGLCAILHRNETKN